MNNIYKIENVELSRKKERPIYVTATKEECDTLIRGNLLACSYCGKIKWDDTTRKAFRGCIVVLLQDETDESESNTKAIEYHLRDIAYNIRQVSIKGGLINYFKPPQNNYNTFHKFCEENSENKFASWVKCTNKNDKNDKNVPNGIVEGILKKAVASTLNYKIFTKKGVDIALMYIYENGVYSIWSKPLLQGYIAEFMPSALITNAKVNAITNLFLMADETSIDIGDVNKDENIINFKNGLYNVDTGVLDKHTPEYISTFQLNAEYFEEKQETPIFNKYINELCSDETGETVDETKKAVIQEYFGLCISNIHIGRVKKSLFLYSPVGNTGKSQLIKLIDNIIGEANTAHIPVQKLSERFAISELYGKHINTVGDQQADNINNSSIFKSITGGDRISCEIKGKTPFDFIFNGAFIFACNSLPSFTDDKGSHVYERIISIKCEYEIPFEKRDKQIFDKMLGERNGIIQWALEGLKRLKKNNYNFTYCQSAESVIEEYRQNSDSVRAFIAEKYEKDLKSRVLKTDFESKYLQWCLSNESGFKSNVSKRNIKDRMEKNGYRLVWVNGKRYYKGLKERSYEIETNVDRNETPF